MKPISGLEFCANINSFNEVSVVWFFYFITLYAFFICLYIKNLVQVSTTCQVPFGVQPGNIL